MTENSLPLGALPNLPEFSVSEISRLLKRTLEERFDRVRVRGEISGFKRHSSGHLYLCLKDAEAVLDAVIWRSTAIRLDLKPEDGMEVICTGRITTYPGRSKYQLAVESIELAGAGALLKLLEQRKRKLAAEGLFDLARKKPLPYLPEIIGVVTSPTGAVIRDILHRLSERFPRRVILWPVAVQGAGAAEQVAAAIAGFNKLGAAGPRDEVPGGIPRPDLIIVARGGGSLEDLWPFNEEIVARAAAASAIPLISAIGHETDTTLIDFASDKRAPTPTAAAEMAVPVRAELVAQVMDESQRLLRAWSRLIEERRTRLQGLARGLPDPVRLLEQTTQRLDDWSERFVNAGLGFIERRAERLARVGDPQKALGQLVAVKEHGFIAGRLPERMRLAAPRLMDRLAERIDGLGKRLENLSYKRVLARGYALVRDKAGEAVTCVASALPKMPITIEFRDGSVGAVIDDNDGDDVSQAESRSSGKSRPKRSRGGSRNGGQGSLL